MRIKILNAKELRQAIVAHDKGRGTGSYIPCECLNCQSNRSKLFALIGKESKKMKQLIGHISPETAYVVSDYPYGFRLRTQIRYWVETKKNFGQRFVSQTMNPKNGNWNKPKAGTYYLAIVMYLDAKGHVTTAAFHPSDAYYDYRVEGFVEGWSLDEYQSKAIADMVALQARLTKAFEAKQVALQK